MFISVWNDARSWRGRAKQSERAIEQSYMREKDSNEEDRQDTAISIVLLELFVSELGSYLTFLLSSSFFMGSAR